MSFMDDELASTAEKAREVKEMGGATLTVQDKFSKAGMSNEYESIFRSLSLQVHPTYAGILKRHFEMDHANNDFEIRGFASASDESVEVVTDTAGQLVEHAIRLIEEFKMKS